MQDLDELFIQMRTNAPQPSDALMARIMADAMDAQPRRTMRATPPARMGFWATLSAVFGGAGALAGVGSAAMAGLVLGIAQPAPVSALTQAFWGTPLETVELIPSLDGFLTEE